MKNGATKTSSAKNVSLREKKIAKPLGLIKKGHIFAAEIRGNKMTNYTTESSKVLKVSGGSIPVGATKSLSNFLTDWWEAVFITRFPYLRDIYPPHFELLGVILLFLSHFWVKAIFFHTANIFMVKICDQ